MQASANSVRLPHWIVCDFTGPAWQAALADLKVLSLTLPGRLLGCVEQSQQRDVENVDTASF